MWMLSATSCPSPTYLLRRARRVAAVARLRPRPPTAAPAPVHQSLPPLAGTLDVDDPRLVSEDTPRAARSDIESASVLPHGVAWFDQERPASRDALTQLFDVVVREVVELVGEAAVLSLAGTPGGPLRPAAVHHSDPEVAERIRAALIASPNVIEEGVAGVVAVDRRPLILSHIDADLALAVIPPESRSLVIDNHVRAILIVPLMAHGQVMGTLGAIRSSSDQPYTSSDLAVLETIAERAAEAVADARRVPRPLTIADFEAIYRHSLDGVMFTVPDGRILAANPAACEILGLTESEICRLGRSGIVVGDDPRAIQAVAERNATGSTRAKMPMIRGDGQFILTEISSATFKTPDGEDRACVIFRDVTADAAERAELQAERLRLTEAVNQDPLTGLYNRHGFMAAANEAVVFADRSGAEVQLVFCDLDGFKAVNDRYGHRAGDDVLVQFGAAISSNIRAVDRAARFAGDEFVILLYSSTRHDALIAIERIRDVFTSTTSIEVKPSFSAGIASRAARSSKTLDQLFEEADREMYNQKARTRVAARRQESHAEPRSS